MNEIKLLFPECATLISLTRSLCVVQLAAKQDVLVETPGSHRATSTRS